MYCTHFVRKTYLVIAINDSHIFFNVMNYMCIILILLVE